MAKKLLYIIDPLSSLNPATDTTLAIMEEAGTRGHKNFVCELKDIVLKDGALYFMTSVVQVPRGYTSAPTASGEKSLKPADDFAAIFMRKDPPVDQAFVTALLMLRHYNPKKTVMINHPGGLLEANEKLFGLSIAKRYFPKTIVATDKATIIDFIAEEGMVAVKPLFGSGGAGVLILEKGDRNLMSALELLTSAFTQPVMVQAYIKDARVGDKRIIILGGEAVGAILRVPRENDHRANFHAGGTAQASALTASDHDIVEALAPHLRALGLHFVGIDIIGGFLTEINVTSPTCVIEIERFSQGSEQRLLRAQIVDYVEKLLA